MATNQQWIVRYRHYVDHDQQSSHVAQINSLNADASVPFNVEIDEGSSFSIGGEVKGYLAKCDGDTKTELEALPEVFEVEPLQYYKHVRTITQQSAPWGLGRLSRTGPLSGPNFGSNFAYTYRSEASGDGVTAYIIDTGINKDHVEFEGRAIKGPKFVRDTTSSDDDIQGHGTHVAGTIGGKTFGVAKNVTLVGVKVFGDNEDGASTIDIIKALEWIVSDVYSGDTRKKAVANLSFGGGKSETMDAAIAAAVRQGVVVVVAAGNEKMDADASSPAREPLAITVGATDINDKRAEFSNYGRKVDVFAPGVDITSAWIAQPGKPTTNKETKSISGTSMASPHVAGVAATILSDSSYPIDAREIIGTIIINADKGGVGNLDNPALEKRNPRFATTGTIAHVN